MRDAIIVASARTPIGKAYRGALNNTQPTQLAAHAISHALARSGIQNEQVDDVVLGCAMQQGSTSFNIARQSALAAGMPVTVSGMSVDRQCASGLFAIATAAKQIVHDKSPIAIGGGVESISLVQNDFMNTHRHHDPELTALHPAMYMPMLETAETVANRYNISREQQDLYALESQRRTAEAQHKGLFDDEVVPIEVHQQVTDKTTGQTSLVRRTLHADEGNRPDTTLENLSALKPVYENGCITAGNASQLSDGAAAVVMMDDALAAKSASTPLGIYRGVAVAG